MPIIKFTAKDKAQAAMGDLDPRVSEDRLIREENADDCEGLTCEERPELALPPDEYRAYVLTHRGERPPVGRHSHMVVSGDRPPARERHIAVFKTGQPEQLD
jgi:hypothetical protein